MPSESRAELYAARNEWEAFQIVIRDSSEVRGIDVSLSDLAGTGQAVLGADQARVYREYFVDVTTPSPAAVSLHERAPGLYPDPLVPFRDPYTRAPVGAPFDLGPDETGVVFVDWYVPPGTPPGAYAGTATVTATTGQRAELPVRVTVWDFDIPKTIATAFGLGMRDMRPFHGGPDPAQDVDYEMIVDRYLLALHEHRIDPTTIQGPVEFSFDAGDNLIPVDWRAYDAAVGPWLEGSRFPDGVGVARFNVGRFRPGSGIGNFANENQYKKAAAAFAEHLQGNSWWERAYVYAIDEPWSANTHSDPAAVYESIRVDGERLIDASDLWRGHILVTSPYAASIDGVTGIWCPATPMYDDWWYFWDPKPGWDAYSERLALGEELWFYACNQNTPPYAGYDIDSAIGYEPRIVSWGAWYERASGFLYWRTSYWVDGDPWNVLLDRETFGSFGARNGDGMLLYPGDHDGTATGKGSPPEISIQGPVVSYRLEQARDGLEDWELFKMTAQAGGETWVRKQVGRAYTRFGTFFSEFCDDPNLYCANEQPWTLDEEVLYDARRLIAAKLLYLNAPDEYPDPEAPAVEHVEQGCGCHSHAPAGTWIGVLAGVLAVLGRCRRRTKASRMSDATGNMDGSAPRQAPARSHT